MTLISNDIPSHMERKTPVKILVFGSLNIDYVMAVDHIIAPGETEKIRTMQVFPGGKGLNQAVAIARAGYPVSLAGNVGATDGRLLLDTMTEFNIDSSHVREHPGLSGSAYIQVDSSAQNCILIAANANRMNTKASIEEVISQFVAGDLLLLQNEINLLNHIVCVAHQRGLRIYLNPSPFNEELQNAPLEWIDGFIFNEIEGEQLTGEGTPIKILDEMHSRYPHAEHLLTLGAQGAILFHESKKIYQAAYLVEPIDTTAAGDTFTGFYLAETARGSSVNLALDRAAKAAAIATTRRGAATSIPSLQEVVDSGLTCRDRSEYFQE